MAARLVTKGSPEKEPESSMAKSENRVPGRGAGALDAPGGASSAQAFVVELGRALLLMGTPAHRLEESLARVSERLRLDGQFYSTPTALIVSFAAGERPITHLVRCEPGHVNLKKLVQLDGFCERVVRGSLSPLEGAAEVRRILAAPRHYGAFTTTLFHGFSSCAVAGLFTTAPWQVTVAGAIGLAAGALSAMARASVRFERVWEFATAFLAALTAHAAASLNPVSLDIVTLSGLIALVPGLTIAAAMTELTTQNLVSGTARLMGAVGTLLKLGFGVALGGVVGERLFGAPAPAAPAPPDLLFQAGATLASAISFTVIYQARRRDVVWILAASTLAVAGSRFGIEILGSELGHCLGAFLAVLGSNLYSRWIHRPARVPLTPSIILLVPGSIGLRSVKLLLESDAVSAVNTAFSVALAAISLAAGFLFANLLVPPRRLL